MEKFFVFFIGIIVIHILSLSSSSAVCFQHCSIQELLNFFISEMKKIIQIARQIRPEFWYKGKFSSDGFEKRIDFRVNSNRLSVYSLARNAQSRNFCAGIANFDTGGWC